MGDVQQYVNPFPALSLFLYPLKTSENLWFSGVFRGYKKKPVALNGLTGSVLLTPLVIPEKSSLNEQLSLNEHF